MTLPKARSRLLRYCGAVTVVALTAIGLHTAPNASARRPQSEPDLGRLRNYPEGGIIELVAADHRTLAEAGLEGLLREQSPHPFRDDLRPRAAPVSYLMSHTADPEKFPHRVGECVTPADGASWLSQPRERTYIDAGTMTFRGGPQDLVMQPMYDVDDREGRHHDVAYTGEYPGELYVSPGTEYEVHLSGSDQFPETTYEPGEAFYLPQRYREVSPGVVPMLELERGRDVPWRWEPPAKPPARDLQHYHFIGFWSVRPSEGTPGVTHWCLHEDTGEFTIPKDTIDDLAANHPAGLIIFGAVSLRFSELKGGDVSERRLTFVGTYLYGSPYRIVDPAGPEHHAAVGAGGQTPS